MVVVVVVVSRSSSSSSTPPTMAIRNMAIRNEYLVWPAKVPISGTF